MKDANSDGKTFFEFTEDELWIINRALVYYENSLGDPRSLCDPSELPAIPADRKDVEYDETSEVRVRMGQVGWAIIKDRNSSPDAS